MLTLISLIEDVEDEDEKSAVVVVEAENGAICHSRYRASMSGCFRLRGVPLL